MFQLDYYEMMRVGLEGKVRVRHAEAPHLGRIPAFGSSAGSWMHLFALGPDAMMPGIVSCLVAR